MWKLLISQKANKMTNLELIKTAYANEDFEETLSLANRFLSENPQNFEVLSYKGVSELNLGLNYESVETLTKCLATDDQKFGIWVFRGDAYYELGEYEKSFSDHWNSLQLEPDNAAVMDKCARSLFRLGKREYALEYISKAVERGQNVGPFIIKATMLRQMGDEKGAEKVKEEALLRFPEETEQIMRLL